MVATTTKTTTTTTTTTRKAIKTCCPLLPEFIAQLDEFENLLNRTHNLLLKITNLKTDDKQIERQSQNRNNYSSWFVLYVVLGNREQAAP